MTTSQNILGPDQAQNAKAVSEDTVRLHAFWNWTLAGKPEGDGVKFWLDTERELLRLVAPAPGDQAQNAKAVSEDTVRLHAFWNWTLAGKLEGDGVNFWLQAERELSQAK
jgi:hypothetical protein